jgi:small-conductance mechanosensitive channel
VTGGIFEWEFVVLLLDVALVILYFILVRSIDFEKVGAARYTAPASRVALLVFVIFVLYILWDFLTKVVIFWMNRDKAKRPLRQHFDSWWWRNNGVRMLPSLICLILSYVSIRLVKNTDAPHLLTADFALIAITLLFRTLKDFTSSFPKSEEEIPLSEEKRMKRRRAVCWIIPCSVAVLFGLIWSACSLPLPSQVIGEIQPISVEQEHMPSARPCLPAETTRRVN